MSSFLDLVVFICCFPAREAEKFLFPLRACLCFGQLCSSLISSIQWLNHTREWQAKLALILIDVLWTKHHWFKIHLAFLSLKVRNVGLPCLARCLCSDSYAVPFWLCYYSQYQSLSSNVVSIALCLLLVCRDVPPPLMSLPSSLAASISSKAGGAIQAFTALD